MRRTVVSILLSTSNHNFPTRPIKNTLVVSILLSTSNHNYFPIKSSLMLLFQFFFLHQTTTYQGNMMMAKRCFNSSFYIKPQPAGHALRHRGGCFNSSFYIKPQLRPGRPVGARCCFNSSFYIKPQPFRGPAQRQPVVSILLSTSNHNLRWCFRCRPPVVSILLSTSNHNLRCKSA